MNIKNELIEELDVSKLKKLNYKELDSLCSDIRKFLIQVLSNIGGHLSSNLAVVELTMALFRVFDSPKDKIIWDIGHQSYIHKIVTGRASKLHTIRKYNGLSGFIKRSESEHDIWEAGHASTSLSASLGLEIENQLLNSNNGNKVISVIGDGSLACGVALEALNHIGYLKTSNIIILNDNKMSISQNIGALQKHINKIRVKPKYLPFKKNLFKFLQQYNHLGTNILKKLKYMKNLLKKISLNDEGNFFTSLGIDYIGPIDGHNIKDLEIAFYYAKSLGRPIVVHVITKKGKGFNLAENDVIGEWHGVEKFCLKNGLITDNSYISWSEVVSKSLLYFMKKDISIVVITPAMISGSKLENIKRKFPQRIYDTGITESHATIFSAALGLQNKIKPFLSIYSTFLQRAYDQMLHDVARHNIPLVIGVDRCGFANGDGETHHGIYDVSFMMSMPNLVICMAKDPFQLQQLIYNAFYVFKQPVAIRIPRGSVVNDISVQDKYKTLKLGVWQYIIKNIEAKFLVISYGPILQTCFDIVNQLLNTKMNDIDLINAIFLKPIDEKILLKFKKYKKIIVVEEVCEIGGLGSTLISILMKNDINIPVKIFAIEDKFFPHGSREDLLKLSGLNKETLEVNIRKELGK